MTAGNPVSRNVCLVTQAHPSVRHFSHFLGTGLQVTAPQLPFARTQE